MAVKDNLTQFDCILSDFNMKPMNGLPAGTGRLAATGLDAYDRLKIPKSVPA